MREVKMILEELEFDALFALAEHDLRTPNAQVRWLIRQEAVRRGLLTNANAQEQINEAAKHAID